MAWPTPQDYSEAMQSPQISFSDPELKTGQVETDKLGLPRPISGRFAIVYKMHCGTRHWAVRCFQTEVPDQQQRYAAISDHLKKARLPYTVGFEFIKEGIRIKGQWYPILKMEWIEGQPLNIYVEQHLSDAPKLIQLAESWMIMTQALRKASLAHGDLQDGNVLVLGSELKLLDYDGMYVPALAGRTSSESGHRNYQHPARSASDYGLYLDNFSDWVIYISLIALAVDPGLWAKLKCGDECLLFRKDDFQPLNASGALAELSQHTDKRLNSLAATFGSYLALPPAKVPYLTTNTVPGLSKSKTPKPVVIATPAPTASTADWLSDYVKLPSSPMKVKASRTAVMSAPPAQVTKAQPAQTGSPTWLADYLDPTTTTHQTLTRQNFQSSLIRPRLESTLLMMIMIAVNSLHSAGIDLFIDPFLVACLYYVLAWSYRRDPSVQDHRALRKSLRDMQAAVQGHERAIRENEAKQSQLYAGESREKASLDRQNAALIQQEDREKEKVNAVFKSKSDSILTRINSINRPLQKLKDDYQASVTRSNDQVAKLNQEQAMQVSGITTPSQQQFIQRMLREARIEDAGIPGIGPKLVENLAASGYVTAAHVDSNIGNVGGIGSGKAQALIDWRQSILLNAQSQLPTQISPNEIKAIITKFDAKKQALVEKAEAATLQFQTQARILIQQTSAGQKPLDNELSSAQTEFQTNTQAITAKYLPQYTQIKQQKTKVSRDYNKQRVAIALQTDDLKKMITDQNQQIAKVKQELAAYQDVTFARFIRAVCLGQRRP